MWTDEQLEVYVSLRLDKCYFFTASAIASQAIYAGFECTKDLKFEKLRSKVFDMIRIYKQKNSHN